MSYTIFYYSVSGKQLGGLCKCQTKTCYIGEWRQWHQSRLGNDWDADSMDKLTAFKVSFSKIYYFLLWICWIWWLFSRHHHIPDGNSLATALDSAKLGYHAQVLNWEKIKKVIFNLDLFRKWEACLWAKVPCWVQRWQDNWFLEHQLHQEAPQEQTPDLLHQGNFQLLG